MRLRVCRFLGILLILTVSCGRVQKSHEEIPVLGSDTPQSFDDTVYCFNGHSIVFLDGRQGVIDDKGSVLIDPDWDNVDFLSDEVLLLRRSGLYFLSDLSGRVFSESTSREELESSFQARYNEFRVKDILYWDDIIHRLDSLCNACLAQPQKNQTLDVGVISDAETIKRVLETPSGRPDSNQIKRIEAIVERFDRYRR